MVGTLTKLSACVAVVAVGGYYFQFGGESPSSVRERRATIHPTDFQTCDPTQISHRCLSSSEFVQCGASSRSPTNFEFLFGQTLRCPAGTVCIDTAAVAPWPAAIVCGFPPSGPGPSPSPAPSPIPSPIPSSAPSPIPSPIPSPVPSPAPSLIPSPIPSPVCTQASGTQVVANPSFESTGTWSYSSTGGVVAFRLFGNPFDGQYEFLTATDPPGGVGTASQTITVCPSRTYRYSLYVGVYTAGVDAPTTSRVTLTLDGVELFPAEVPCADGLVPANCAFTGEQATYYRQITGTVVPNTSNPVLGVK
ncbi:hypothetical protein HK102_000574, partial [Quaeritorhiza haematococci]